MCSHKFVQYVWLSVLVSTDSFYPASLVEDITQTLQCTLIFRKKGSLKKNHWIFDCGQTPPPLGGGGSDGWGSQSLGYFIPFSKPICELPGSPKTYFAFSNNSIYYMFSILFDPLDITSHLIFVKSCPTVTLCFYCQNKSNILQNLFHVNFIMFLLLPWVLWPKSKWKLKKNCLLKSGLRYLIGWIIRSGNTPKIVDNFMFGYFFAILFWAISEDPFRAFFQESWTLL